MTPQNIPINGRIAIIDDELNQALPLMELFGKSRIPYNYYSGDLRSLPQEDLYNDVRFLFLDINLLSNATKKPEELRSALVGVISRVISDKNYPYFLIYWSRHENEYKELVEEIFTKAIPTRAPIGFLSLTKSDFIGDEGELKKDAEEIEPELILRIKTELNKYPIYGYLMDWENQIHISADKTLEEIFKLKSYGDDWNNESEHLFYKLALAYAGKQVRDIDPTDQIKSAFFTLNSVFNDSLEFIIQNNLNTRKYEELKTNDAQHGLTSALNKKLLLSEDINAINAPGVVLKCEIVAEDKEFEVLLNGCFNRKSVENEIEDKEGKDPAELKKLVEAKSKGMRQNIRDSWIKIFLLVTPLCDYAQSKYVLNKIVKGMLIDAKFRNYINISSESFFISPVFKVEKEEKDMVLILDFRHFFSYKEMPDEQISPLFRLRQQILAEIQSKLSRHINRQGIMFLE